MATKPPVKTKPVTRNKLAAVFDSHELVKAFEDIADDVSKTLPDATQQAQQTADDALALSNALKVLQYVLLAASADAPQARALAVGPGLSLKDDGPGGHVTLDLALSAAGAVLSSDVSEDATQFTDAQGMSLSLAANASYMIEGVFGFQAAAAVPSIDLGFTLPSGATIAGRFGNSRTNAALTGPSGTAGVTPATGTLTIVNGLWMVKTDAAAGNAQLRFRSLLSTYAVTLKAGQCVLSLRRIA